MFGFPPKKDRIDWTQYPKLRQILQRYELIDFTNANGVRFSVNDEYWKELINLARELQRKGFLEED